MACDVCLYGADDVENEFFAERQIVARKPHRCGECERVIPVGATYRYSSGKSDDGFFSAKTCLLCDEVRRVFYCGMDYYLGMLWNDMEEQAFPSLTTASECFRDLSPEAKSFVLDRWTEWKGLRSPAPDARSGSEGR